MRFLLSDKYYDLLKWITLVLLPSVSTLYLALSSVWNLPYPTEIVGTLAAVDVFLGALLGISTIQYRKLNNPIFITHLEVYWILSGSTYDFLRWLVQPALPALSALYFAISQIWSFPNPDKVVTTIMSIATFIGMLLQFSTSQFNRVVVTHIDGD